MQLPESPEIKNVSWGKLEVEKFGIFKDTKLFPGGARKWDWNETGTHHVPGIQIADVKELVEHGADTIILSRGILKALQVKTDTLEFLDQQGIKTIVCQTRLAVEKYNELRIKKIAVGGLFHSTC